MTSMLYTVHMNRLILPEAVMPGKHYSFRADMRLNAWTLVAVVVSFPAHMLLPRHKDWHPALRAIIALAPLAPSLFYVRSIARWIGGMDELQRRIQLEACLFATTGTIFITTTVSLLNSYGIRLPRLQDGLGWEGTFASVIVFYILGNVIGNRRYR
jgi:hypothetical protein